MPSGPIADAAPVQNARTFALATVSEALAAQAIVVANESLCFGRVVRFEVLRPAKSDRLKPELDVHLERSLRARRRRSSSARGRRRP